MFQRIKLAWNAHFSMAEVKSVLQTFLGVFIPMATIDAGQNFSQVLAGNFSKEALLGLFFAITRSMFKAVWSITVAAIKNPQPSLSPAAEVAAEEEV